MQIINIKSTYSKYFNKSFGIDAKIKVFGRHTVASAKCGVQWVNLD